MLKLISALSPLFLSMAVLAVPQCPQTRLWQISSYTSFAANNATSTDSYVSFHFVDASVPSQYNYFTDCSRTVPANPSETGPGSPADPNDFIGCGDYTTEFKLSNPYTGMLTIKHEFSCNTTGNIEDMFGEGSVDLQGLVDCDNGPDGETCIADFDMTYDYSNAE